jgi:hypothetical protein
MDWYRVDRPDWYVGEGWALTPEAAGVAEADHQGLAHGSIRGWMRRDVKLMMIGGRNLEPTARSQLKVTLGGRWVALRDAVVPPGPFLVFMESPTFAWDDAPDYVSVDAAASPPARLAIEQFDTSPGPKTLFGFGDGWHEQELNPRTGLRWRWLSERGELKLVARSPRLTLHLEGESPRTYFSRGSRLVVRAADRIALDTVLSADFSLDVAIDAAMDASVETIVLETDQVYIPAEQSRRTQDRRHLGLRIFKCEIRRP